jgi:hypothetical protein
VLARVTAMVAGTRTYIVRGGGPGAIAAALVGRLSG